MTDRRLQVPPRDSKAEPVCSLDAATAASRQEPPNRLLDEAFKVIPLDDGIEYRFQAGTGIWDRVATFIEEEGECCPFLAFEVIEAGDHISLRATLPEIL